MKSARIWFSSAAGALLAAAMGTPEASAQNLGTVSNAVVRLESDVSHFQVPEGESFRRQMPSYTERFADGELLYRLRDYARAAILFTDLVSNYANTPAYPNSLYLLGESLYQAGDRLGARTQFNEVVHHADDPVFRPFVQRSLGRLIEIALRTGDLSGIEETFQRLNQIPPSEVEAQTTYIRGKYYFLRANPDYEQARVAFEAVPARAPVYPQARYFLGAILTAQERYPEAIEAFQRVLQIQAEGAEQQQVLDLASLAIGRLQLERQNYDAAIEAYQTLGRSSPYFDRSLFEQSWAFIRQGDTIRAEHALEILAISNPDSPLIPEGKLLWGNLLLRTGRFDRAQQVFQEVRNQFGPISQQLNEIIARNTNPETYFEQLILSNIQVFDASSFIPQEALAWVRTEGTLEDSLGVVADLNVCRQYIRESDDLISRLTSAINSPSRAHVFNDMRVTREHVFEALNRVTVLRSQIAATLDPLASGLNNVDLDGVINERHGLDEAVRNLPLDDAGIRRRDRAAEQQFVTLGQELQRNQQRVDNLEAMIVAIERYVADPSHSTQQNTAQMDQLRGELATQRAAITNYRERIAELRRLLSAGRSQIGVGDPRYERDLEILAQYRDLVNREVAMLQQAGRTNAEAVAMLERLNGLEQRTLQFDAQLLTAVDRRISGIRSIVQEEEGRVAGYRTRLAQLETEASDVVGHLIMQSFSTVRLHFYQIVMRADLGLVDVAWEQREEHHNRERMLGQEENREIDALNDEFNEVTEGAAPDNNLAPQNNTPAGGAGTDSSGGTGAGAPDPTGGTSTPSTPAGGGDTSTGAGGATGQGAGTTAPQGNAGTQGGAGASGATPGAGASGGAQGTTR